MSIPVPGVKALDRRVTLHVTRPTVVAAIVLSAALAGCGYKGPLSMPKPEGLRTPPAVVLSEPEPDRPVPSEAAPPPK